MQGLIAYDLGRYDEALPAFERTLELKIEYWGPESPELANILNNLAITHSYRGRHDEAIAMWQRAVELLEGATGRDHPRIGDFLGNIGATYENNAEHSQAEKYYAEALDIKRKSLGPDSPGLATSSLNLGGLRTALGRYEDALPVLKDGLRVAEAGLGMHQLTVLGYDYLGEYHFRTGDLELARQYSERAYEISEQTETHGVAMNAQPLSRLGSLELAAGDYAAGEGWFRRALEHRRAGLSSPDIWLVGEVHALGLSLFLQGRLEDASATWGEAADLLVELAEREGTNESLFQSALNDFNFSRIHDRRGEQAERVILLERALGRSEKVVATSEFLQHLDLHAKILLHLGWNDEARPFVATLQAKSWNDADFLRLVAASS
ncbi:MAG: tetratricopeptide repeat protein, partial [Planctomycetota bacterium]